MLRTSAAIAVRQTLAVRLRTYTTTIPETLSDSQPAIGVQASLRHAQQHPNTAFTRANGTRLGDLRILRGDTR